MSGPNLLCDLRAYVSHARLIQVGAELYDFHYFYPHCPICTPVNVFLAIFLAAANVGRAVASSPSVPVAQPWHVLLEHSHHRHLHLALQIRFHAHQCLRVGLLTRLRPNLFWLLRVLTDPERRRHRLLRHFSHRFPPHTPKNFSLNFYTQNCWKAEELRLGSRSFQKWRSDPLSSQSDVTSSRAALLCSTVSDIELCPATLWICIMMNRPYC